MILVHPFIIENSLPSEQILLLYCKIFFKSFLWKIFTTRKILCLIVKFVMHVNYFELHSYHVRFYYKYIICIYCTVTTTTTTTSTTTSTTTTTSEASSTSTQTTSTAPITKSNRVTVNSPAHSLDAPSTEESCQNCSCECNLTGESASDQATESSGSLFPTIG